MVGRNTLIIDRSTQAADRLEKTTNSRSPQTQKCDMQETNGDNLQTHKLYHFQNCGAVYMDSFNASGVRTENCGNIAPKVTRKLVFHFFFPHHFCSHHLTISYYSDHRPTIIDNEKDLNSCSLQWYVSTCATFH